jgi:Uma2 family endonuclease
MVTYRIALGPELDWLPDDTEEALLGTTSHQGAIVILDTGVNYHKRRNKLPWLIGNQLKLIIPRRGGGVYQPSPDILIHPTLGDAQLSSLSIVEHGPPALVIEVTSPATARSHDLDTISHRAKPQAYEECGIPEYLVFDPLGEFIPDQIRAWRIGQEGGYDSWLPDPTTGRWHSALGISFAPQGIRLRVYDSEGALIPTMDELDTLAELAAAQARELTALRAELRRLRGE